MRNTSTLDPMMRAHAHPHERPQPLILNAPTPTLRRPKPTPREKRLTKDDQTAINHWQNRFQPAHPNETKFRHMCWQPKRDLVRKALVGTQASERQLDSFDQCGSGCIVEYCKDTDRYRLRANTCKCRHCAPCAATKAGILARNLKLKLETEHRAQYRFITLTLKHSDTPLADQIKRLYTCFKRLRRQKLWKKTQDGGAAILEVKWTAKTRQWHPHLHIVAQGRYLAQRDLSSLWHVITTDSPVVDIRTISSGKDAAHYVAKYVSKGTVDEVWNDTDAAQEWVIALKGVRTAATYGAWRQFKLLAKTPDEHAWNRIGLLTHVISESNAGAPWAKLCLDCLLRENQYNPHRPRGHRNE